MGLWPTKVFWSRRMISWKLDVVRKGQLPKLSVIVLCFAWLGVSWDHLAPALRSFCLLVCVICVLYVCYMPQLWQCSPALGTWSIVEGLHYQGIWWLFWGGSTQLHIAVQKVEYKYLVLDGLDIFFLFWISLQFHCWFVLKKEKKTELQRPGLGHAKARGFILVSHFSSWVENGAARMWTSTHICRRLLYLRHHKPSVL